MSPLFQPPAPVNAGATSKLARMLWGPVSSGFHNDLSTGNQVQAMTSVNSGAAVFAMAPHDGIVDRIGFNVTAIGGTPPAFNAGIVTYDAGFNPTTTPIAGSAIQTFVPAVGWTWLTLATPPTVTAGTILCARIWPGATVPDATNNATFSVYSTYDRNWGLPAVQLWNGTSWVRQTNLPLFGMRYQAASGGDVFPQGTSVTTSGFSATFTNATNPDTIGAKFQVPLPVTCAGAQIRLRTNTLTATADVQLLDASNNVLATASLPPTLTSSTSNVYLVNVHWNGVPLAANTDYRLVAVGTSTSTLSLAEATFADTTAMQTLPEGSRWSKTARQTSTSGAWTDTSTIMPMMGLWITGITG